MELPEPTILTGRRRLVTQTSIFLAPPASEHSRAVATERPIVVILTETLVTRRMSHREDQHSSLVAESTTISTLLQLIWSLVKQPLNCHTCPALAAHVTSRSCWCQVLDLMLRRFIPHASARLRQYRQSGW